jgi:hypothetical protein
MLSKLDHRPTRLSRLPLHLSVMALALCLGLATTGCLSSLAKHSTALSAATAPVVDEAAVAYRDAEALHDLRVDYDAVAQFDATQPVYNPHNTQVLLPDKDIQTRLAVLEALQVYAKSLVEITKGTGSHALDEASESVGRSISSLGNALASSIASTLGIATGSSTTETTVSTTPTGTTTTVSSTPNPVITPEIQNVISTAANALGQYLVSRKIKKELPQKIEEMDPHIQALCKLLEDDIGILQDEEKRDYDRIINLQTLFIRENANLNPEQRRIEIMKLPEIVRQQRGADQRLTELRGAISRLALTHHALAADAQGNNPESLTGKLEELAAAGSSLGKFYSSPPTQ